MRNNRMLVKIVVFTVIDRVLRILLPDKILPAGSIQKNISLDETAKEIFKKKTSLELNDNYFEQLYTFSRLNHQAINIEVTYFVLVPAYSLRVDDKKLFIDAFFIKKNSSDYRVISYAIRRLQWKIEYTNVVYSLLPSEFTLSELQTVYEAILGRSLDKRNFRKKMLSLGLLRASGRKRTGAVARPAMIYEFKKRSPVMVKVFK